VIYRWSGWGALRRKNRIVTFSLSFKQIETGLIGLLYSTAGGSSEELKEEDAVHIDVLFGRSVIVSLCEMDNGLLVSLTLRGRLMWWDLRTKTCERVVDVSPLGFAFVEMHPIGPTRFVMWMESNQKEGRIIDTGGSIVNSRNVIQATKICKRRSGGGLIVVPEHDGRIQFLDSNLKHISAFKCPRPPLTLTLCELTDGSIVRGTDGGTIEIWKLTLPPKYALFLSSRWVIVE